MGAHSDIRDRLLNSRKAAEKELALLKGRKSLTQPIVTDAIRRFVLQKYLLIDDVPDTDRFDDWVQISLAKSARIAPELTAELDTAQSCDGATSAMAKKVLLFMAIERTLGVTLDAAWSARIGDMDDFGAMVWDAMARSPQWHPLMEES